MHTRAISGLLPVLLWVSLTLAAIGAASATLAAGGLCIREYGKLLAIAVPVHTAGGGAARNPVSPAPSLEASAGATPARTFDELARISAKLAREQQIQLLQLQSDPVNKPLGHLAQLRVRLQLRGDYVDTKVFLISLLANFRGLALDRLTIRHVPLAGSIGSGMPAMQRLADEFTIDLIQYGVASQVSG